MTMQPYDPDQEIQDFEYGDLGNIPEHTKEWYEKGAIIIVVGISDGDFTGQFDQPAKSLLHYLPEDDRNVIVNPWGLLMPANSKAMDQAKGQLAKSGKPFYAFVSKKQGKNFSYWLLESASAVFNQDGTIGGFRLKDGSMFTNRQEKKAK